MNQLPTLPLLALLLSAATASAQTTFHLGLRGGLNRALTTVDPAGTASGSYPFSYATDKSALYAWQAGVAGEVRVGNLAFQPALLFSQKGEKLHTDFSASGFVGNAREETTSTNRYNWLELPLNFVYTPHGDHGLQLFAGPYLALALGGRRRGTAYYSAPSIWRAPQDIDEAIAYGSNTNNRRLDAGISFGVGYRQGPVQVQLGYGLGLRNLHQSAGEVYYDYGRNFQADAARNRVAQLTGTYFFSL